jgi:lysophospholipase L1-like esterase
MRKQMVSMLAFKVIDSFRSAVRNKRRPLIEKKRPSCMGRLEVESLERRDLPSGLVAAFNFNLGTGTVLPDVSGKNNSGTISNAVWSTTAHGSEPHSLYFDGSNAIVNVPNASSLDLTSGMTLEAWVNPTALNGSLGDVISKGANNYYLAASSPNGNDPAAGGTFGGKSRTVYGSAALPVNTWTFVTATYNGRVLDLYENSVLVSSLRVSGNILASSDPLQIGGNNLGNYFTGYLDDVRIYNQALTAAAIQTDMNTPVMTNQTITVTTPTSALSVGKTVTLSATASSGLPVAFSIASGPGSLGGANNSVLTATGPGSIVIDYNQAGNSKYNPAPAITQTIVAGNFTAQQANSYDNAWQAAWIAHSDSIYTTVGKTLGFVLEIGDSITQSNPYSQWPHYGAGQTPADQATVAWAQATSWNTASNSDTTNKNGWYLAAADTSSHRGMTAAGGMSTDEFLSGSGNVGAAMPLETNPQTAQAIVADGVDYLANLQVNTVAAAFSDAQFAVLMLGTNDAIRGVSTSTFIANLTSIVNVLQGQEIVVILSTIPPNAAYNNTVMAYNTAIRNYAQSSGLPLIDYYAEILARAPGTSWQNTLIGSDGTHPTAYGAAYNSASNPYTPGGDPATQTTGDACLNVGYLLRSWLTIQMLGEIDRYVVNGNPPAGGAQLTSNTSSVLLPDGVTLPSGGGQAFESGVLKPETKSIQVPDGQQQNLFRPGSEVGVQPTQGWRAPAQPLLLSELLGADPLTDGGQGGVDEALRLQ